MNFKAIENLELPNCQKNILFILYLRMYIRNSYVWFGNQVHHVMTVKSNSIE